MPSGDGTGPLGLGPMTGRAAGFCAGYPAPGYLNAVSGRGRGFGYGRGRGFGRGRGRGYGRGYGAGWAGYPNAYGAPYMAPAYSPDITPRQEADMLKAEAKAMQDEIEAINRRVKDLESRGTQENS